MLYTGKGDNGTTKLINCPPGVRVSKSDFVFETLGTIDELNSSLGYAKFLARRSDDTLLVGSIKISYEEILENLQQCLFSVQAEIGGSETHPTEENVYYLEKIIYEIETLLPPIKSFIIPGGGEMGAYLDVVRTITRRAERACVTLKNKQDRGISDQSLKFLNRLSSVLYALARFANYQEGFTENKPDYN